MRGFITSLIVGAAAIGLLPFKHKPSSPHAAEGSSPAPELVTTDPAQNTTAASDQSTAALNPAAVVSSESTPSAWAGGVTDAAGQAAASSQAAFEIQSLRTERDELLATVADLQEQVKRLTSYTAVKAQPAVRHYPVQRTYSSCGPNGCGPAMRTQSYQYQQRRAILPWRRR